MENKDIKELIVNQIKKQSDLCMRHGEDISVMKVQIPAIKEGVDKLVARSEKWEERIVTNEKDIVVLKAKKTYTAYIVSIALILGGIVTGVFGEQIVNLFK